MKSRLFSAALCLSVAGALVLADGGVAVAAPPSGDGSRVRGAVVQHLQSEHRSFASVRAGGFVVSVPKSITSFNHRKVRVVPSVQVASGVQRVVTSRRIAVYSGKRRVASGSSARLGIGRYTQAVTVGYRAYRLITKHRTVTETVYVDGGYPNGTTCTIQSVSSSGTDAGQGPTDDTIDSASCTNSGYPGQTVTASGSSLDDVSQGHGTETYTVGQQVTTGDVYFDGYTKTVQRTVAYRVRSYSATHRLVTRKSPLIVKDGGYLKVWAGSDTSGRSITFTTTGKARWAYVLECDDYGFFGVVWRVGDHSGSFGPEEYAPYGESSQVYRAPRTGRTRFQVFAANCYWAIGVLSKSRIR